MPKLKHPASGQTIEVAPASVDIYLSQGWEKVTPAKKKAAAGKPDEQGDK